MSTITDKKRLYGLHDVFEKINIFNNHGVVNDNCYKGNQLLICKAILDAPDDVFNNTSQITLWYILSDATTGNAVFEHIDKNEMLKYIETVYGGRRLNFGKVFMETYEALVTDTFIGKNIHNGELVEMRLKMVARNYTLGKNDKMTK